MPDVSLTVLFMPESAYGPTNNCIGIGHRLRARSSCGVRRGGIVGRQAAGARFRGRSGRPRTAARRCRSLGRRRRTVLDRLHPRHVSRVPQADHRTVVDVRAANVAGVDRRRQVLPAATAGDHRTPATGRVDRGQRQLFPSTADSRRAVRAHDVVQPAGGTRSDVPPAFSGYPVADRTGWDEFRAEYDRTHRPMWTEYDEWVRSCGAPALPDLDFIHTSQHLNLYLYPEVVDYAAERPLDATWHRLDSSVRATDAPFEVPASLRDRPGSLVYLSLGSLGSADVELMKRLVDVLGRTPHRYIVSKGPQHDQYELADNMWGDHQVPQTTVLPLVDLVITHGGNNTTTEELPLRQADDRLAAVLGPVRQRGAGRRDGLRQTPRHLHLLEGGAALRDRPAAQRRRPAVTARRSSRRRSRPETASPAPPT